MLVKKIISFFMVLVVMNFMIKNMNQTTGGEDREYIGSKGSKSQNSLKSN